ncbi:MAG: nuclear transport factor 2 family protein [Thermoleophilaceae bacterium]
MAEPDSRVLALERGYEAFSRGDLDQATVAFHPDIEVVRAGGQPPIKGLDRVRAWLEPDAFEQQLLEPVDFQVAGDRVLVRLNVRARGAGSGIELELDMWSVWTFDADGLATRVEIFLIHEEADALEAAGLAS